MKIDTVIIENKEYYIVQKFIIQNNTYYMLISTINEKDMIIRRLTIENGKEYLVGLVDEEEFNLVINEYYKLIESSKVEV